MGKVYHQSNLQNLEQAFNVAEKDLGVTRLLDPEGKTDLKKGRILKMEKMIIFLCSTRNYWEQFISL